MEIKINLVEVAIELANDVVRNPFRTAGYTEEQIDDRILTETEGVLHYKEEYQDEFNTWYDRFFNKILFYSSINLVDKIINKLK